jgi:CBS domain-containing protein
MRGLNIGFLVVYEAPAGAIGVITDRDITVRGTASGRDPTTTEVREAMTTNVVTCYDDEVLEDAAWLMERHAVRRLVVLDRARQVVGIVSVDDLARALGSERLAGEVLRETSEPV